MPALLRRETPRPDPPPAPRAAPPPAPRRYAAPAGRAPRLASPARRPPRRRRARTPPLPARPPSRARTAPRPAPPAQARTPPGSVPVPERGPYGAPAGPGRDAEAGAPAGDAAPHGSGPLRGGPLPHGPGAAADPEAPAPVPYGAPVDPTAGQGPGGAPAGGAAGDGSCSGAGGPAGLLPNPASEDPPAADPADELPEAADPGPVDGPRAAFDALYRRSATALARQAYLLTGNRGLALEAVERAFQQAWARWPEVATDPDPVGWVRAAAHEYALSPWHRFRRAHRHPEPPAGSVDPADRVLMDAVLALPPVHRRTVLLYHAVGLDLPDTAAETEATTPTAGHRLLYAHEDLACRVPAVAAAPPQERAALLHERLGALRPPVRLVPRPAAVVRGAAEHRARRWSRTVAGVTALLTAATALHPGDRPHPVRAPGPPRHQRLRGSSAQRPPAAHRAGPAAPGEAAGRPGRAARPPGAAPRVSGDAPAGGCTYGRGPHPGRGCGPRPCEVRGGAGRRRRAAATPC
ncbi:hypothetical protein [Streptomyces sp. CS62]|uniref:hypothetical protein n=1 Tax=Streptomyces sp. CS62 TaxID=3119268 RepID=UPI002F9387E5